MLSDKIAHVKSGKARKPEDKHTWYSDSQKLEAVKLWLLTGNMAQTAATLNIPLVTIKSWRYSKWWDELVQEIKTEGSIKLSNKLKKVAEKAWDVALDRLENGDWIYDQKTGQLRRKPVAMRDAHQVAVGALDRALVVEKRPVEEAHQQKVTDRLEALANAFSQFSKKTTKIEVMDIPVNQEVLEHEEVLEEGPNEE